MKQNFDFGQLIDSCTGTDGKLLICLNNASLLSFSIKSFDLFVWVTGEEESKRHILNITDELGDRNMSKKKAFAVREGLSAQLIGEGLVDESKAPEDKVAGIVGSIPSIKSVIQH